MTYSVNNQVRNAQRQANRVARKFGNKGAYLITARAMRRAAGNLNPVNPVASIIQHPEGRFSKSIGTDKRAKLLAGDTTEA